jgi:hypothetical protein
VLNVHDRFSISIGLCISNVIIKLKKYKCVVSVRAPQVEESSFRAQDFGTFYTYIAAHKEMQQAVLISMIAVRHHGELLCGWQQNRLCKFHFPLVSLW